MKRLPGILTAGVVVSALAILPMGTAMAAEPLPEGSYDVLVGDDVITVAVDEAGAAAVTAPDGMVVLLAFDDEGRVLDEFVVEADDATYGVDLDVAEDGSWDSSVEDTSAAEEPTDEGSPDAGPSDDEDDEDASAPSEADEDASAPSEADDDTSDDDSDDAEDDEAAALEERHGLLVSTVARCAPRGRTARTLGWPSHGTVVSSAANGLTLSREVVDPATGEATTLVADFGSMAGAEAFCDVAVAAVAGAEDARAQEKADRKAAKEARKAEREEARAEREADEDDGEDGEADDDGAEDEDDGAPDEDDADEQRDEAEEKREKKREKAEEKREKAEEKREEKREKAEEKREKKREKAEEERDEERDGDKSEDEDDD